MYETLLGKDGFRKVPNQIGSDQTGWDKIDALLSCLRLSWEPPESSPSPLGDGGLLEGIRSDTMGSNRMRKDQISQCLVGRCILCEGSNAD